MEKEGLNVEFKREYIDDIRKSIIAFANTDGGIIYIGIEDDGTVCGVNDTDNIMLKVTNSVRDSIKPDITLFMKCDVAEIDEKQVVRVTVQRGTACPYYISGKGIRPEGVYVRQGASSVPASESHIIKMLRETDGERYEAVRSLNQELTFHEASEVFRKRNVDFGVSQYKSLKLTTPDGIFTNLGLLISDQCCHSIKFAVFEGTEKIVFKNRRELTGSLFKQLDDAYEYIDKYNAVHAEVAGLYRTDTRDYPEEAVREALLNALVHRDYAFSGSTLISIFDDRIEFVSIGGLLKGVSLNDIFLGVSFARNEYLANLFYRLSLIEAYGTGMPKIMRAYKSYNVQPKIETSDNAFKITLPNVNISTAMALSDSEKSVIALLEERQTIVRRDVEISLGIGQTAAGRIIKLLLEKKLIKQSGSGKNIRYSI